MNSNILTRISFVCLLLVVALLPVFFLPFTNIPVETSKGLFLVIGVIASVIFWIIARFFDGKIAMPRSMTLLAGAGVVLVLLLSSIFSGASNISLFGTMLDLGTFWFILCAFLLMFISSIVFRDAKKAKILLFGTVISAAVVIIFQALHLFLPKVLSLGVLVNNSDNILGSWNTLGIFAGFSIICSLFIIEFFSITKTVRIMLSILTLLAVLLIAVVNFVFIWEILGVFALLIFIYKISINTRRGENEMKIVNFPTFSFVIVLVSLFFFMSASFIGGTLASKLHVSNNEVGPSLTSTLSVTEAVIKAHPVLGIGPNRFGDAWAMYKPNLINQTQFWDVSFNSGSGVIPTLIATTGILGVLAWLLFFLLFIFTGVKWLFFSIKNNISMETVSFFFLALFLFVSSFFYFAGTVIFLLAFVYAGVFIGLIASSSKNGEISFTVLDDHRKTFFFMLFLIVMLIVSAALGFKYIQRFASIPYFTKTLSATKIEDAESYINKALSLNNNDIYLRTYSQVYLLNLNSIVANKSSASALSDGDKALMQASLDQAINGAQVATNYDNKNYLNFQMLGTVYQTAGSIGVTDAYAKAFDAYKKASDLNPANPRLKLILMNISSSMGNTKQAKDYATAALALKPDYIDALVSLAQIAKNEGNNDMALAYAQKALSLAPTNKDLISYVDSLRNGTPATPPPTTTTTKDTSIKKQ